MIDLGKAIYVWLQHNIAKEYPTFWQCMYQVEINFPFTQSAFELTYRLFELKEHAHHLAKSGQRRESLVYVLMKALLLLLSLASNPLLEARFCVGVLVHATGHR